MRNFKFVFPVFFFLFLCTSYSYGQPLQELKDRFKTEKHGSNKRGKVTTKGPQAKPSLINSMVSTNTGLQLKFTVYDRNISRISIYRKDKEEGGFQFVKSVKPNSRIMTHTFVDPARNLKQGREYCYLIRTWLEGQVIGTPSKGNSKCQFFDSGFKPQLRPDNPTNLKVAKVTSNSVTVTFLDQSNNEEYFFLERKEPHHEEWIVTAVKPRPSRDRGVMKQVKIKNASLEMEQSYQYRVRAVNENGSSLSNTIQVKTYPIETGDAKVKITHPSTNILQVAWEYDGLGNPDWEVSLYDMINLAKPISTNLLKRNQKRMTAFDGLDPSKQYCIVIKGLGGGYYQKVCDSPFAKRKATNQTGPVVPRIRSIERGKRAGELIVNLVNERQGQLVDLIDLESGQRRTIEHFRRGDKTFPLVGLGHGRNYCIRMFTTNEYGTRYSSSVCQSTAINPPRKPFVTNISEDHVITVEWTSIGADEHTFEYRGTKSGALDHNGTIKMNPPYNWIEFQAKAGYSYCFRVRSKNEFDLTDWSPGLCGVISEEKEEVVSFAGVLTPSIPESGNVTYLRTVAPGNNSRLRKVHVAGNTFTPYIVQFLPVEKNREHCGTDVGVFIEPGRDLEGADLVTLYGNQEPKTPVLLKACKLQRYNDKPIDLSKSIPVQIDYVKK